MPGTQNKQTYIPCIIQRDIHNIASKTLEKSESII